MKKIPAFIAMLLVSVSLSAGETKLSQLRVPAASVGEGWSGPTGLVIDDIETPPTEPPETKEVAAALQKQMRPLGVKALADFTYRKEKDPLHQVTIRVFLFETSDQCQNWMKTKYQFDGWEKKYKRADRKEYTGYDSLEMRKRIVAFNRVWITAGTVAETDDHVRILDLYVAALKKAMKEIAVQQDQPDK